MFFLGKKKYSDEQKLLFQRWHDFIIVDKYTLEYVHHTGTQMLASVPIPEFKDKDKLQQFVEDFKQDIEAHGLHLHHLSRTRLHYIIAVRLAKGKS